MTVFHHNCVIRAGLDDIFYSSPVHGHGLRYEVRGSQASLIDALVGAEVSPMQEGLPCTSVGSSNKEMNPCLKVLQSFHRTC